MRGHVEIGYDLVSRIPLLQEVAELILAHHERFDGTGYPKQLRGEQIPLSARIFAVADAFDAMTTPRPYQATRTISHAIAEIRQHAGLQFDQRIVNAFLEVPVEILARIHAESKEERRRTLAARKMENDSPNCGRLTACANASWACRRGLRHRRGCGITSHG